MRNLTKNNLILFSDAAANGSSIAQLIEQFRFFSLALDTTNSAAMTIKIQVSNQVAKPDFSASQSPTNQWAYAEIQNPDDHSLIAGGTGIVLSGTDFHKIYTIVSSGPFRWLGATISNYSAGQAYLQVMGANESIS